MKQTKYFAFLLLTTLLYKFNFSQPVFFFRKVQIHKMVYFSFADRHKFTKEDLQIISRKIMQFNVFLKH